MSTTDHPVFLGCCAWGDRHHPAKQVLPGASLALRGERVRGMGAGVGRLGVQGGGHVGAGT